MKTYYIVDESRYNDFGEIEHSSYQIRYRKKFLWLIPYWKYITHRECGMGDISQVRTNFSTIEKAEKMIKEVLCPNKIYDGWKTTTVGEIKCS